MVDKVPHEESRMGTVAELLDLLDSIAARHARPDRTQRASSKAWDRRLCETTHPLAHDLPDEPLVSWFEAGLLGDLHGAKVVDVGCGNGRNARWLASKGANVIGIDIAPELLHNCARRASPREMYLNVDILREPLPNLEADLVYDSGCFHHVPPHRRPTYIQAVLDLVARREGKFGIVAFNAEKVPTGTDLDIILNGGTGSSFSLRDLESIFSPLAPLDIRPVKPGVSGTFSPDFLNAALFKRVY